MTEIDSRNPRIAILLNSSKISGAEKRAIQVYKDMLEDGLCVDLWISGRLIDALSRRFPEILQRAFVFDEYKFWKFSYERGKYNYSTVRKFLGLNFIENSIKRRHINALIKERGISLLHVFLEESIGSGLDSKVMVEVTSPDFAERILRNSRDYFRDVDFFHPVSQSVYERMTEAVEMGRMEFSPAPYFSPSSSIEKSCVNSDKERIVCFAHRFISRKNPLLFAAVAKDFLKKFPHWRISMLGDGPLDREVKSILADEISSGRAEVCYKKELNMYLMKSSIFVSLIEPDNYPSQSVLEAMHACNAILISNTGQSAEKFLSGNGAACQLDFRDVLEKLCELASDEQRLREFCKRSRELVEKNYKKANYISHLKGIYTKVLNHAF